MVGEGGVKKKGAGKRRYRGKKQKLGPKVRERK